MTPVIGARITGRSIRTGPIWMGASVWVICLKNAPIGEDGPGGKAGGHGALRLGAMTRGTAALIVAAGSGGAKRAASVPKQFAMLAGKADDCA